MQFLLARLKQVTFYLETRQTNYCLTRLPHLHTLHRSITRWIPLAACTLILPLPAAREIRRKKSNPFTQFFEATENIHLKIYTWTQTLQQTLIKTVDLASKQFFKRIHVCSAKEKPHLSVWCTPKMFHRYEALGKMLSKTLKLIKIYVAVAHSGKYVLRYMSVQLLHVKTGGAL